MLVSALFNPFVVVQQCIKLVVEKIQLIQGRALQNMLRAEAELWAPITTEKRRQ